MALQYASKGVAGAGLGTGIAGLSLGVLNSMGGLLGAGSRVANTVAGVGCYNNGDNLDQRFVSQAQFNDVIGCISTVATKDAELAQARAEVAMLKQSEITNDKIVEAYQSLLRTINSEDDKLRAQIRENELRLNALDVGAAKTACQIDKVFDTLNAKIDCCCNSMNAAINLEAERRNCADNKIVSYVNTTFQPNVVLRETAGDVTITASGQAETTFNPLCNCQCGN